VSRWLRICPSSRGLSADGEDTHCRFDGGPLATLAGDRRSILYKGELLENGERMAHDEFRFRKMWLKSYSSTRTGESKVSRQLKMRGKSSQNGLATLVSSHGEVEDIYIEALQG